VPLLFAKIPARRGINNIAGRLTKPLREAGEAARLCTIRKPFNRTNVWAKVDPRMERSAWTPSAERSLKSETRTLSRGLAVDFLERL
jgi:hypothetical protein